jgi:outer membrane lipoprotein-sorting protein
MKKVDQLDHPDHDDLLDRAIRALRETPVPERPARDELAPMLADVDAVARAKHAISTQRIFTMKSIMRTAVAASVLLALGLGVLWVVSQSGPTLAFADAADALLKVRTVTCRLTGQSKMKMTLPMELPQLPEGVRKKMGPALPKGNGKVMITTTSSFTSTGRLLFLAPNWQRMEMEQTAGESTVSAASAGNVLNKALNENLKKETAKMPGAGKTTKTIQIFDTAKSESLWLDPSKKTATLTRWQNMPQDSRNQANLFFNVRAVIEEARSGKRNVKLDSLGEKTIDGRPAVGYAIRQDKLGVKWEFWFDSATAQTVRIELAMGTASGGAMEMSMVMDQFRTDVDLDQSLFSLEAPEGYTTQTMTFDASEATIVDLGKLLRAEAQRNKGVFPDKLPDPKNAFMSIMKETAKVSAKLAAEAARKRALGMEAAKKRGEKPPAQDEKPPQMPPAEMQAAAERAQVISRGCQFLAIALTAGTDWHYAGRGVKLDTPDVPIFWYKPAGSEKYKVLCADLTVKELAKDELPKVEPLKSEPPKERPPAK